MVNQPLIRTYFWGGYVTGHDFGWRWSKKIQTASQRTLLRLPWKKVIGIRSTWFGLPCPFPVGRCPKDGGSRWVLLSPRWVQGWIQVSVRRSQHCWSVSESCLMYGGMLDGNRKMNDWVLLESFRDKWKGLKQYSLGVSIWEKNAPYLTKSPSNSTVWFVLKELDGIGISYQQYHIYIYIHIYI